MSIYHLKGGFVMEEIIVIIAVIIDGVIFGYVANIMGKEKGYDGCFWWGFFLSFIGAILVGLRPNLKENQSQLKCECSNNMEYDDIHNSSSNNKCARITEYSNYSVNKTAELGKLADLFLASKISSEEYKKKKQEIIDNPDL